MENSSENNGSSHFDLVPDKDGVFVAPEVVETPVFDGEDVRYTYEFGTLTSFESRLNKALYELDSGTGLSNHFIRAVRHSIHQANLVNDVSNNGEISAAESQQALLTSFSKVFQENISPLISRLQEMGINEQNIYFEAINNFINSENQACQRLIDSSSQSPSFGSIIKGLFSKDKAENIANISNWRDETLKNSFASVDDLISKMRGQIGDPVWEKNEGLSALNSINETMEEIEKNFGSTSRNVNDQMVKKKIADTQQALKELSSTASSPEFKELSQRMAEALAKFFDRFLRAIGLRKSEVDVEIEARHREQSLNSFNAENVVDVEPDSPKRSI